LLALIGIALGAALVVVGHVPIVTRGLEIVAGALVGTMLYGRFNAFV
jgi:hypothetical protein